MRLLNEASLNMTTFRHCSIGLFLAWNPQGIYFQIYRCCDSHFPGFGKYIFAQLQAHSSLILSFDCTEGFCSSNIIIIFEQLFNI